MLKMFCSFESFHMNSCFFVFERSNRYRSIKIIDILYNNTDRRILSLQTYTGRGRFGGTASCDTYQELAWLILITRREESEALQRSDWSKMIPVFHLETQKHEIEWISWFQTTASGTETGSERIRLLQNLPEEPGSGLEHSKEHQHWRSQQQLSSNLTPGVPQGSVFGTQPFGPGRKSREHVKPSKRDNAVEGFRDNRECFLLLEPFNDFVVAHAKSHKQDESTSI